MDKQSIIDSLKLIIDEEFPDIVVKYKGKEVNFDKLSIEFIPDICEQTLKNLICQLSKYNTPESEEENFTLIESIKYYYRHLEKVNRSMTFASIRDLKTYFEREFDEVVFVDMDERIVYLDNQSLGSVNIMTAVGHIRIKEP
jgi:hypothetical protein